MNRLFRQACPLETAAVRGTQNRHRVKVAALTQMGIDFAEFGHGNVINESPTEYPLHRNLEEFFFANSLFNHGFTPFQSAKRLKNLFLKTGKILNICLGSRHAIPGNRSTP